MARRWVVCCLAGLGLSGWLFEAQGAPPALPEPFSPPSGSVLSKLSAYFDYDSASNAVWHQAYFQRNGAFFKDMWSKAYEEPWGNSYGSFGREELVGPDGYLPAGNYKWWVRGWNETDKYGPWSTKNMTFSIPFIVPDAPTPLIPVGTNTVFDMFAYRSTSSVATWCNIYVTRNNVLYRDFWDRVWPSGDKYVWVSEGGTPPNDPRWPAGDYKWWVREWSPVSGMGKWSTNAMAFTIQSAALPKAASNLAVDVSGFYSGTRPRLSIGLPPPDAGLEQSASATWIYYWMNRNGVAYKNEIFLRSSDVSTESGMLDFDLPAGRYDWWVQTINSKGGAAWVQGPSFTNAPTTPAVAVLSNVIVTASDADIHWTPSKGVYWHQVWVNRNGSTYFSKWIGLQENEWGEISDESDDWNEHCGVSVDKATGVARLEFERLEPGNYQVWLQTWTSAGSKWSAPAAFVVAGNDAWDPADNTRTNGTVLLPQLSSQDHGPHVLTTTDTQDWFRIDMVAGTRYHFCTVKETGGCGYRIYDADGDWMPDAGWLRSEQNSVSVFLCGETGRYYVQIKDYDAGRSWSDPVTGYTLRYWSTPGP